MALGSSVLPLDELITGTAYCCVANCFVTWMSVTLRQPAPPPYVRLLWVGTPLPNLPVRAPAADAFTEEPLTTTLLVRPTALAELRLLVPAHSGP